MKRSNKPTQQAYAELQQAYDWFNGKLFGGSLSPCLITLQRNKRSMGYYSHDRFVDRNGAKTDEIALNPEYFAVQSIEEVLSTLVHEMAHLWQQHFGHPGRGKYHNQEWADKMIEIGLQPSNTASPGGKTTGDQMDHYIVHGKFLDSCRELLLGDFQISWYDRYPATLAPKWPEGALPPTPASDPSSPAPAKIDSPIPAQAHNAMALMIQPENASNRLKYACAGCKVQVWGKPSLNLICGDCQLPLMVHY